MYPHARDKSWSKLLSGEINNACCQCACACACDQDKEILAARWKDKIARWNDKVASREVKDTGNGNSARVTDKEAVEPVSSSETEDGAGDEDSPTGVVVPPRSPRPKRAAAAKCDEKLQELLNDEV